MAYHAREAGTCIDLRPELAPEVGDHELNSKARYLARGLLSCFLYVHRARGVSFEVHSAQVDGIF